MQRISVIDSHTGGEPTRTVIDGGPDTGHGSVAEQCATFQKEHDLFRSAVVNEPRGSDVMVGAMLCPAQEADCATGVIFFNNVGTLGMCVHGTIGVVATLAHMGRIEPGMHRLDTPVGVVTAQLADDGKITVGNVLSYRYAQVAVDVQGYGTIMGDVAWGGNWFFLVNDHQENLESSNVKRLTEIAWRIKLALIEQDITGENEAEIDHIELFGPPVHSEADSRNFVLCPGNAYDRSPCGTGTSAKLACLMADRKLRPEEVWRQESIIGSIFEGWATVEGNRIRPFIRGTAHITSEATLILDDRDPFRMGIRG